MNIKINEEKLMKYLTKPYWFHYLFFLTIGLIINFLFYQFDILAFNNDDLYFDIIITIIDSAILASVFILLGRFYLKKKIRHSL